MFDMRYHIVSLVAVFLALAMGILLGTSIESRGVLRKQQDRIIKSIEEDILAIRKKNSALQKQLQSQKKFENNVLPALVNDKLEDQKVALIYFKDASSANLREKTLEVLQNGKATTVELAIDRKALLKIKATNQDIVEASLREKDTQAPVKQLAIELSSGAKDIIAQILKDNNLEIEDDFFPVNSVVMYAGGNRKSIEEEVLIKELKKNNIKVVFVDKTANNYSKIERFIEADIDTIDNIDMVYGQISLVRLLLGSDSGHFGIKPSANALMPTIE